MEYALGVLTLSKCGMWRTGFVSAHRTPTKFLGNVGSAQRTQKFLNKGNVYAKLGIQAMVLYAVDPVIYFRPLLIKTSIEILQLCSLTVQTFDPYLFVFLFT